MQATPTWKPLTAATWSDFERLFGPNGACAGCWCMLYRVPRKAYDAGKGDGNRLAMRRLTEEGAVAPGILLYVGGEPAGWCSVQPREAFPGLAKSRVMQAVDEQPVWSVSCFFIAKQYRRQGLSAALLRAAIEHVRAQGGRIVEAYPVEPREAKMPDVFAWTGIVKPFLEVGFVEVARRTPARPVLRYFI
jgi:GNAT superfamily N-acetyltransferase